MFQAAVIILDSQFENLNNVQIFVQQTQVIIRNSSFDNIDINIGGFITLYSNSFVDANLTVTDVNVTYFYSNSVHFTLFKIGIQSLIIHTQISSQALFNCQIALLIHTSMAFMSKMSR